MNNTKRSVIADYDRVMWTFERIDAIPFLNFPKKWNVRIIPPFMGATIRFQVTDKYTKAGDFVSVFLDMDENLGMSKKPYWEVFPCVDDVIRVDIDNTEKLMKTIKKSLKLIRKEA